MEKLSKKEYKKKVVKQQSLFLKLMILVGVYQIKVKENSLGKYYYISRINPYNPLSYLIMVFMIIFGLIGFFVTEAIPEIISEFKYK